jgi:hypothetical protein
MASDMSGYQGADGKRRWIEESGGNDAAYNRENASWQASQGGGAPPAAAPARGSAAALRQEYGVGSAEELRRDYKQYDSSKDVFHQDDAEIDADAQYYDEAASQAIGRPQYRSRREGVQGMVDKAGDCPEGSTLHGEKCISYDQANSIFGGGYGGVPEGAYGGASAASSGAGAAGPAVSGRNNLQQGLIDQYQGREGQFVGAGQGAEELSGGGVFWGQQPGAPGPPPPGPTSPAAAAISSGSGATPLSAGVTPAGSSSPAAAPAPLSVFSGGVGQISSGLDKAVSSAGIMEQAPTGTTALKQSLAKQYADPNQWWQKGALEA